MHAARRAQRAMTRCHSEHQGISKMTNYLQERCGRCLLQLAALILIMGFSAVPAKADNTMTSCPVAVIPVDIQQLQQAYQAAEAAANEAATNYFAAQAQFMQLRSAWQSAVQSGAGQAAIQQAYNLMNSAEGHVAEARSAMAAAAAAMTSAQL